MIDLVFFDLEAVGPDPATDRLLQLNPHLGREAS